MNSLPALPPEHPGADALTSAGQSAYDALVRAELAKIPFWGGTGEEELEAGRLRCEPFPGGELAIYLAATGELVFLLDAPAFGVGPDLTLVLTADLHGGPAGQRRVQELRAQYAA